MPSAARSSSAHASGRRGGATRSIRPSSRLDATGSRVRPSFPFLIDCSLVPKPAAPTVLLGPNPRGSILPPSDRGRQLGRRLRSFLFPGIVMARLVGRQLPVAFRLTPREAPSVRIDRDGDHPVRAGLPPPPRP